MEKYTVIGEHCDNTQGYAARIEAPDADQAIDQAQAECAEALCLACAAAGPAGKQGRPREAGL